MLETSSKELKRGILIWTIMIILASYFVGIRAGENKLLESINKHGQLDCEQYYCYLYLEGTLDIGSDFQISREY